jgi:hypothetical protein
MSLHADVDRIGRETLYTLVDRIDPGGRTGIANALSLRLAEATSAIAATDAVDRALVGTFARDGYLPCGRAFDERQVAEIRAHLDKCPVYDGHVIEHSDRRPETVEALAQRTHLAAYDYRSTITAPHFLSLANDPRLLAIAEGYLGCVPTLYSLHAWWSFGGRNSRARLTQAFHRDPDDFRFCVLFVYLTDVTTDADGPHQMIRSSHLVEGVEAQLEALRRRGEPVEPGSASRFFVGQGYEVEADLGVDRLFADATVTIRGPAGTGFLVDTYGLHRGLQPRQGRRLVAWARYGFGPNNGSVRGPGYPVPRRDLNCVLGDDDRTRYINRLLVDFN